MRIHRLTLESFKGVRDRTVAFPDTGITVLHGRNESGKSSTIEAFELLLEAPDSSSARTVKAAAPVGDDVGVAVEAEFTLQGHRLLYRKQWLKAKKSTLRFLEGPRSGETLSGREAHDAVAALREETDQTLWTALRLMQNGHAGTGRLTESSALKAALEQASGGAAQSESGSSLLLLAQQERGKYWTGTGRENAQTKDLRERHRAAVAAHDEAQARLERVVEAEEALERATRTVRAAEHSHTAAVAESERSRAAAEALEDLRLKREQAAAAAEVAASRAEQTERDQVQRRQRLEQVEAAEARKAELDEQVETLQEKAQSAQESAAVQQAAAAEAQEHEEEARRRAEGLRAAQRRVQDHRRREELTELIARLDELAENLAALEARQVRPIPQDAVDEIETAERVLGSARAQFEAGSAQLVVTALGGRRTVVIGDEHVELAADAAHSQPVTERVEVELSDQLRVSVAPEAGREDRRHRLDEAGRDLDAALRRWEVETAEQARDLLHQETEAQRERRSLTEKRTLLLARRDEAELRREHERLERTLGPGPVEAAGAGGNAEDAGAAEAPETAEPVGHRAQTAASVQQAIDLPDAQAGVDAVADAEAAAETAREALRWAQEAAVRTEAAHAARREELGRSTAAQEAQTGELDSLTRQLEQARAHLGDEDLAARARRHGEELEAARSARDDLDRTWDDRDADQVLGQHEALARRPENLRLQLDRARDERSRAEGALGELDRDARQAAFDRAATDRRVLTRELNSHLRRAAAARLLAETLEHSQAEAHRRYTEPFKQRLEHLGAHVFGSRFRVEVDEDLAVTRRYMHGTWIEEACLSTGAREQLAVLVRLAVATLVDPDDGVPVVLDDALGHSDPGRLASLAAALEAAGRQSQVIVLTATPERFAALDLPHIVAIGD